LYEASAVHLSFTGDGGSRRDVHWLLARIIGSTANHFITVEPTRWELALDRFATYRLGRIFQCAR
jgi:hypothetical protein